ncbi:MAG: hypothetical protein O3C40_24425, partial [Planctomycetota bacterium]|nr:hypothetical protein [Planctomycetota bacterium]
MPYSARILIYSLLAICQCAGCRASRVEEGYALTLVVSGDTAGWIVPCGCTSNQSGGLSRRGGYLQDLRGKGTVLYVDAGGAASGTSEYDRLKFEAILRGEAAMGIEAHNIGAAEARLGADFLRETASKLGVPLLTCNVRDSSGALVGERLRVIGAAGRKIALVGVLSDREPLPDLQIDSPRNAVLAALEESAADYDSLVVLAYLPQDELIDLAANLPEADLVIGGPTGQSVSPRRKGPTLVASATNKGKFLAVLTAPAANAIEWQGEIVEMTEQFKDDTRQQANLDEFYATLAERDLTPSQTSFALSLPLEIPENFRIAGTASCRDCHKADCETWDHSGHAHAWDSLTKTGAQVDAFCQQCHATGSELLTWAPRLCLLRFVFLGVV